MSSYEHLLAAAAAQKLANPDIPLAAYDVGFNAVKSSNTTNTALCLSNLPYTLKEDDIARMFDNVVSVNIIRHRDTNKPRGMAIVQFTDAMHCNIAYDLCQCEQIQADNRVIRGDYSRNGSSSGQMLGQPSAPTPIEPPQQSREWKPRPPQQDSAPPQNRWNSDNQRDTPNRGFQDRAPREPERRSRFDAPPPAQNYPSDSNQFQQPPPPRGFEERGGGRGGYRGGGGFQDRRESGGGSYGGRGGYQDSRGGSENRGYQDEFQQGGGRGFEDRGGFQERRGGYQDRGGRGGGFNDRRGGGFQDRGGRGGGGGFNDRRGGGGFQDRGGFRGGRGGGGGFRDRSEEGGPRPSKYGVTSACVRELPTSGRPQRPSSSSSSGSAY